ncbi:hydroxylysine kinase [Plakobranchus ocellatus]|uniref:Hydroxylysine kinase n=1 Tax=Plakobranchus ocellatus TaxID=259542 RepID=A0AAV4A7V1_9GAST|nr:hydroxylysine kinase [Plakobranchus ocellatus]
MSEQETTSMDHQRTQTLPAEVAVPMETPKPRIENINFVIRKMLKQNYDLRITSLKPLDGFYDLNYHVVAEAGPSNPHINSSESDDYFLKICNAQDSKRPEFLYAVALLLEHIRDRGIVCQETIRGIKGQIMSHITSSRSSGGEEYDMTYLACLRTYLPGRPLEGTRLTPEMLYNLGQFVARTTHALQDFHHPFFDTYDHLWNLSNCPKISEILYAITDGSKRTICQEVLRSFVTQVLPLTSQLRKGQIHGDLNGNNILITSSANSNTRSSPKICGLIDLHDTCRSYLVYDLAICAAQMLLTRAEETRTVPVTEIPGHILAGYTSILKLLPAERKVLRTCVAARMVMVLAGSAHSYAMDPGNEYLSRITQAGWEALGVVWSTDPHVLETGWDQIETMYSAAGRKG